RVPESQRPSARGKVETDGPLPGHGQLVAECRMPEAQSRLTTVSCSPCLIHGSALSTPEPPRPPGRQQNLAIVPTLVWTGLGGGGAGRGCRRVGGARGSAGGWSGCSSPASGGTPGGRGG